MKRTTTDINRVRIRYFDTRTKCWCVSTEEVASADDLATLFEQHVLLLR